MPNNEKMTVVFQIDGNVTPLNMAKAIIDSELLSGTELGELVAYLEAYAHYHSKEDF